MEVVIATPIDIANVIQSALVEIGVNGRLDVRMDGLEATAWVGQPTGDDLEVVVTVRPLEVAATNHIPV